MSIKLGSIVKDRISGFTGVVTSRTEWLYGCVRLGVNPQELDKDGKHLEGRTFDEPQMEFIGMHSIAEEHIKITESTIPTVAAPHGDRPNISKESGPTRT
jgi:hypothetical protein